MLCRFFVFFACTFAFFNSAVYSAYSTDGEQKIYISADQIICSDNGIFLIVEDSEGYLSRILVPQVNWDVNGLFAFSDHFPLPQAAHCRHGHTACRKCFRCEKPGCPFKGCTCKR